MLLLLCVLAAIVIITALNHRSIVSPLISQNIFKSDNGQMLLDGVMARIHNQTYDDIAAADTNDAEQPDGKSEVRHIAFLKVHKAGSSTVQNILYRFGLARNLTFVLPTGPILSRSKNKYHAVLPPHRDASRPYKYDILCNHAVFNEQKFTSFMHPDARYVAIIREPLDLFISAAFYFRYVWPNEYLLNINESTYIHELMLHPEKHEPRDISRSRTFNYMARDFGLVTRSVQKTMSIDKEHFELLLKKLSNRFDIVLVIEKFDESLVLLKRWFNWSLKDIMYIKTNEFRVNVTKPSRDSFSKAELEAFRKYYWMDIRLYEWFSRRLQDQIKQEKDFQKEVDCYKSQLRRVQEYCSSNENRSSFYIVEQTQFNNDFVISKEECDLMALQELKFYGKLFSRQLHLLKHK